MEYFFFLLCLICNFEMYVYIKILYFGLFYKCDIYVYIVVISYMHDIFYKKVNFREVTIII